MTKEDIIRMAREAGFIINDENQMTHSLEHFAALVAAAERNSWPAEMEAMERQVNILTDALAQAKAEEREKFCAVLRQLHDSYSLQSDSTTIRARGETK